MVSLTSWVDESEALGWEVDFERNSQGRPRIILPDGSGKKKLYARPSGMGSQLDDKENLFQWNLRNLAMGFTMDRSLLEAFARIEHPHDKDSGDRGRAMELIERAQEIAGAKYRADKGTSLHEATEDYDHGLRKAYDEPEMMLGLKNYVEAIETTKLRYVGIELRGVSDTYEAAGTLDRLGWVEGNEATQIIDLKTSSSLDYSRGKFACQLAVYATMQRYNVYTGERKPLHDLLEVDQEEGLIIWVPYGVDHWAIEKISLSDGRRGLALANEVKEWRNFWGRAAQKNRTLIQKEVVEDGNE